MNSPEDRTSHTVLGPGGPQGKDRNAACRWRGAPAGVTVRPSLGPPPLAPPTRLALLWWLALVLSGGPVAIGAWGSAACIILEPRLVSWWFQREPTFHGCVGVWAVGKHHIHIL